MRARLSMGLLLVASCGRVAFDARDDAFGSSGDGDANGNGDGNGDGPIGAGGPVALVAHVIKNGQVSPALTTAPIDTSGASVLIAAVCTYSSGAPMTPTDSLANTWVAITGPTGTAMNPSVFQVFSVAAPVTGANHTFTLPGNDYLAIAVLAFSGTQLPNVIDNFKSGTAGSPLLLGPIQIEAGNLVVSFVCSGQSVATSYAIDQSFTLVDSIMNGSTSDPEDIASAYLIPPTNSTLNPMWSLPGDTQVSGLTAAFLKQ